MPRSFSPAQWIHDKRMGKEHRPEEIQFFINSFTRGELPDYQMSAWIMAICFQGMSDTEVAALTRAMLESGRQLDFTSLPGNTVVDKHSTGGVGDKVSLILGPIAAAAGVKVPMIAGRGLGHTGGTLDKLESIPGFSVDLTIEQFEKGVLEQGLAIMGQTKEICPADKKLYALRDVTGTVDSLPLICGSIMSKKLAEGLDSLVLDVKFGTGAFMKTIDEARTLAQLLKSTGEKNGIKVTALLTSMNRPLGCFAGNACEVKESIEILEGKTREVNGSDLYRGSRELSLQLAAHMILLAEQAKDFDAALKKANEVLENGEALKVWQRLCRAQGAKENFQLPEAKFKFCFESPQAGHLKFNDVEQIGHGLVELGVGRKVSTEAVDPTAGIEFHGETGQQFSRGQPLYTLFCSDKNKLERAKKIINGAVTLEAEKPPVDPLIADVMS